MNDTVVVHAAPLGDGDRTQRAGVPVTTVARTILDVADRSGALPGHPSRRLALATAARAVITAGLRSLRAARRHRRAVGSLPFSGEVHVCDAQRAQRHRDELIAAARRHHARNVHLFGSVATGRDHAGSDMDFLVDFEPGATLLALADVKDEFQEILGCSVDVLSSGGLKPRDEDIRREAVPL